MPCLRHVDFEVPCFGELGAPVTEPDYAATVMAMSPTAYWRLGESGGMNAADQTGNHDGTYVNSPALGVAGALARDPDTAARFNGVDQYVDVGPLGTVAQSLSTGVTFACWVKSSVTDQFITIFNGTDTGGPTPDVIFHANHGSSGVVAGSLRIFVRDVNDAIFLGQAEGAALTDGQWHWVVVSWDGSFPAVWVDGAAKTVTADRDDGLSSFSGSFELGNIGRRRSDTFNDRYWDGSLDEFAIWERQLSESEIQVLFDRGRGVFKP